MSAEYPFIPDYLTKALENISIPLIDVMHGWLKQEMLDCEEQLKDVSELQDGPRYNYLTGYMEALTVAYCMTYNLSIDRQHIEENHHAKLGI
jgi:hypothetical protein